MGSKKITYILLSILIVGLLIVAYFINQRTPAEKNREQLSLLLSTITTDARSYFQAKNSFEGWHIPKYLQVDKFGQLLEKGNEKEVEIIALGTETGKNGISKVKLEYIIDSEHTNLIVRN